MCISSRVATREISLYMTSLDFTLCNLLREIIFCDSNLKMF
ncbi:hypothetical protein [Tiger frog virus]|uniref:Uncharacterized protein n=1 Tax=Rana tigrina ranavirus TaxID=160691 RepID=Q2WES0_RTRV|nr:hypothetical protein [Tiger frog virus]QKG82222.1 hypothetical protein [Tiger frog virus]QKG82324.1 hypothetical protein [Tiger frog virus]QKG82427.1 hypothetical protein [Tiger frog virus]QKG82530.1 hypothetical protein [Tiger frog virus]